MKQPKLISRDEAVQMLKVINKNTLTGLRNYVSFILMYRVGLRISEVCDLSPMDLDFERNQIFISASKNGKDRWVYVDPETMESIKEWMKVRPESDYLLCTVSKGSVGNRVLPRHIRRFIYNLSKRCKVYVRDGKRMKLMNPHVLRHTYATERIEEGWTVPEVKRQLGHSFIQTTSVYLHARDAALSEKASKIRPLGV